MTLESLMVVAIATLGGALLAQFLWFRSRLGSMGDDLVSGVQSNLSDLLQKPMMDLSERMTRVGGEMRESTASHLNKHFLDTQERLDRTLAQNRQELQGGLLKTTQALETKFQSLEQQVGTRLENIGKSVETKLNENLKEGFKHFEKVQEHLKAAELNPDSPQAYNNLGMVYGNRGDFNKAKEMLEKSIAINTENPRTYTNLGLVYYRLGQPQEALRLWHKALEIDPHFEEALQVLRLSGAEGKG